MLSVTYRKAEGAGDVLTRRSKVRNRTFRASFRIPAGATDVMLYAVYPGDAARGIGGSSSVAALD
jgi:hypothetical protein